MMTVGNELWIKSPIVLLLALFPVSFLLFLGKPWLWGIVPIGLLSLYQYFRLRRNFKNEMNPKVQLKGQNQEGHLSIEIKQLLFLTSKENYTAIYFLDNGQLNQSLLKGGINHFENQLLGTSIQRCHFSYLVNLSQIRFIGGDADRLKLYLRHIDEPIPVSEKYRKNISLSLKSNSKELAPKTFN